MTERDDGDHSTFWLVVFLIVVFAVGASKGVSSMSEDEYRQRREDATGLCLEPTSQLGC